MQIIIAMFGLVLLLFSKACMATNLMGSIVPPFPNGWTEESGACISKSLGVDKMCDYSIGVLRSLNGRVLYIGKSTPQIETNEVHWLVTDQMPFPQTPRGQEVVFSSCELNGELNETIIAVVKVTDTEWYTTVRQAYRANLNTGRFEKISTKGIRCLNEGWGI